MLLLLLLAHTRLLCGLCVEIAVFLNERVEPVLDFLSIDGSREAALLHEGVSQGLPCPCDLTRLLERKVSRDLLQEDYVFLCAPVAPLLLFGHV